MDIDIGVYMVAVIFISLLSVLLFYLWLRNKKEKQIIQYKKDINSLIDKLGCNSEYAKEVSCLVERYEKLDTKNYKINDLHKELKIIRDGLQKTYNDNHYILECEC